jgi:hypothetical protein
MGLLSYIKDKVLIVKEKRVSYDINQEYDKLKKLMHELIDLKPSSDDKIAYEHYITQQDIIQNNINQLSELEKVNLKKLYPNIKNIEVISKCGSSVEILPFYSYKILKSETKDKIDINGDVLFEYSDVSNWNTLRENFKELKVSNIKGLNLKIKVFLRLKYRQKILETLNNNFDDDTASKLFEYTENEKNVRIILSLIRLIERKKYYFPKERKTLVKVNFSVNNDFIEIVKIINPKFLTFLIND